MRNVFDQYSQAENRLTHALVSALEHDSKLLLPFLRWLKVENIPSASKLRICEQQFPGAAGNLDEGEAQGLPDAFVHGDDDWAVLFECKVQSKVRRKQLQNHRATAVRHGFSSPQVVVIAVELPKMSIVTGAKAKTWKEVYAWFESKSEVSWWAKELVHYMQVFEQRMISQEYEIRGTITVFNGLRFDCNNPYTYHEGKRLIRLLGDQLQGRDDLRQIRIDPQGERRHAITGRGTNRVWDFIPINAARGAGSFTQYPHLTLALDKSHAVAAITIPNGIKGGFRSKLKEVELEGYMQLLAQIEMRVRPILQRSTTAKPAIYLTQRRFKSQRSTGQVDARIDADLRIATSNSSNPVKYQPEWLEAIYDLLSNKRSNMQLGIEVRFSYECPLIRSSKAEGLFAEAWIALAPLLDFALHGRLPK